MTPLPTAPVAEYASGTPLLDRIAEEQARTQARYMPVMDVATAIKRVKAIKEMKDLLLTPSTVIDGVPQADGDYGVIPGTKKDTLLKPGAEKICSFFGYVPKYEIMPGSIEDWTGERYGEPLFYYHIRCTLTKDGFPVGEGTGSANSWESKYRYRTQKRKCPSCGNETIIKGREDFGGGWLCFAKKGGCGEKFKDGDTDIEAQMIGRVANEEIFDLVNNIQKIGDKRSYIAATLSATGASQWFTQDLEDMPQPKPETAQHGTTRHNTASTPQTEPLYGAQSDDPPELRDTLKKFTAGNIKEQLACFASLRQFLKEYTESEDTYYTILAGFEEPKGKPVEHANQFRRLDQKQACIRLLWLAMAQSAAEAPQ